MQSSTRLRSRPSFLTIPALALGAAALLHAQPGLYETPIVSVASTTTTTITLSITAGSTTANGGSVPGAGNGYLITWNGGACSAIVTGSFAGGVAVLVTIGGSQANLTYETCSGPLTCGTAFSFTVVARGDANGFTSHPAFADASTNACASTQCAFTQGYWKNHPDAWPVSTLNLAHMIPLSAVWAGPDRDEHLGAPPLFFGRTEGATPFRFSLHVGDVGHTLVVGPTGAGKSVLLALMALQFRRYPHNQIFAFDFGGSIRAAALAMGGDWHDLGGDLTDGASASVSLQPLSRIPDVPERAWAADWIVNILTREGITTTPEVKEHLWSALTSLASAPVMERTLTGLSVLLQSQALKRALQPYCVGGPSGRLLDAETERLGDASVQAFETEGLIGTGAAPAVLAYLFHRIEDRLDGRPTLLIVDEGWLALDDEGFAGQLREWLKTLRKKNASVVFATQSLSDIDSSAIAPAIIESCQTRLLLPNERAIEPQITAIYRRFGLNDRQIEILARATPKRDYYCQSRRGNRLFELGLGEVALAFCAASSKTDQIAIARVIAEHGRDGFVPAWLHLRGAGWATDLIPDLRNVEIAT